MADIELVIKIDEEIYKSSKKECDENDSLIIDTFTYVIGNGTPLPKGHGRLIDADELFDKIQFADFSSSDDVNTALFSIGHAPTIIEADKGE